MASAASTEASAAGTRNGSHGSAAGTEAEATASAASTEASAAGAKSDGECMWGEERRRRRGHESGSTQAPQEREPWGERPKPEPAREQTAK